jgi:hypothetical protein
MMIWGLPGRLRPGQLLQIFVKTLTGKTIPRGGVSDTKSSKTSKTRNYQKRCKHRKNGVNTVYMLFCVRTERMPFRLSLKRGREVSKGLQSLEYTHQPWSTPRERGGSVL